MAARTGASFATRFPGLSAADAAARARATGASRLESAARRSYLRIVIDNAFPAANIALIAVSAVLVGLGLFIDAFLTAALVLGNIVVGVFQESRAKLQLERIAVLARTAATVIRDGREQAIDPDNIVQGDVVVIGPGDQVQADGAILAEERCSIDESLLTGESDLVRKQVGDRLYSGSFCMNGRAAYRCEHVGSESFASEIVAKARAFRVVRTPLQREVGYVMWTMAFVVALISVGVIESFHDIYGRVPLVEATRAAAVIVTLIPQGLWVMVTVTYAVAIVRMSPRGLLVQRLNAIESMSHVDVLCLDKTGTITTNQLKLEGVYALGIGEPELRRLLGAYAASATISNRTNDAIVHSIREAPVRVIEEVHFDSVRKWSALALDADGMHGLYILGAPEILMAHAKPFAGTDVWRPWSEAGLRVLLFAMKANATAVDYVGEEPQLPVDLTPLGFVILRDELRPGARDTIAAFAAAGIGLKIISGDNPATVAALAREAGVVGAEEAVSGLDLDVDDEQQLEVVATGATVFGRIAPAQKARIVAALQQRGHYVAMIGDGVNDVPALKRSQVAISLRSGSQVTRSIADIILLDDSFSALPAAFSEGRRIRTGMNAIIRLFLARTMAVALVIAGVALLSSEFPLTPRQTAILSALTVGIPALFLAAWARPGLTDRYLIPSSAAFVVPAAALLGAMGVAVYELALRTNDLGAARTELTAAAVLAGVLLIPFVDDPPEDWMQLRGLVTPRRAAFLGAAMLVLFVLAIALEPLRQFYELERLDVVGWAIVLGAVALWAMAIAATWRIMQRVAPAFRSRSRGRRQTTQIS